MKPHVLGAICARAGSKGVPRKNLRPLAGKPLIAHAIQSALASEMIDRVIVSTDDAEIASVAKHYGADVPFVRPAELAGDQSPEWLAWQNALRTLAQESHDAGDIFVSLPATPPPPPICSIDPCIEAFQRSNADIITPLQLS